MLFAQPKTALCMKCGRNIKLLFSQHCSLIRMTSPKLVFYLAVFTLQSAQVTHSSSSAHRERSFVSADVGENITLQCFSKGSTVTKFFWYRQPLGQKPRLMSTFTASNKKFNFHDEWKNDPRFTLDIENDGNNLIISDLHVSDTASYLCAGSFSITFDFFNGILVTVKSSATNAPIITHQSASETIQPGGSVTLNCTVHAGSCDGGQSVYWFKTSEETVPGVIYTSGGKNDQFERMHSQQTCVYNLPLENVDRSHVGTYYCAVASCGRVTFGNSTHLELEDDDDSLFTVYFLSAALTFTTILAITLAYVLMVNLKQTSCQRKETLPSSTVNTQSINKENDLHYAALRVNKARRSERRDDDGRDECIYSSVKQ